MKRLLTLFLILSGLFSLAGNVTPESRAKTALPPSTRLAVFMEYLDPS